jgi:hypothetical protein
MDALIITSIAGDDNEALRLYAKECGERGIHFIVIGDKKSPPGFFLDNCDYYTPERQLSLPFLSPRIIPENSYARKNIGYLVAASRGYEMIAETDDDNFPMNDFWKKSSMHTSSYLIENKGWINVYAYFTEKKIWPRAFPLEYVNEPVPPKDEFQYADVICPVQQGLANNNPDVDAVFRLVKILPITFKNSPRISLGKGTWCPFNSQNTRWFRPAFPLLYLPSYCSFRMTDIWRGFIAQRIFRTNGWSLLFHKPTVYQERNMHNILKDFNDEIPGYLNNHVIVKTLESLPLKSGESNICDNLVRCYESLVAQKLVDEKELEILEAWNMDINSISK